MTSRISKHTPKLITFLFVEITKKTLSNVEIFFSYFIFSFFQSRSLVMMINKVQSNLQTYILSGFRKKSNQTSTKVVESMTSRISKNTPKSRTFLFVEITKKTLSSVEIFFSSFIFSFFQSRSLVMLINKVQSNQTSTKVVENMTSRISKNTSKSITF